MPGILLTMLVEGWSQERHLKEAFCQEIEISGQSRMTSEQRKAQGARDSARHTDVLNTLHESKRSTSMLSFDRLTSIAARARSPARDRDRAKIVNVYF